MYSELVVKFIGNRLTQAARNPDRILIRNEGEHFDDDDDDRLEETAEKRTS